jgi:hypothetical protein
MEALRNSEEAMSSGEDIVLGDDRKDDPLRSYCLPSRRPLSNLSLCQNLLPSNDPEKPHTPATTPSWLLPGNNEQQLMPWIRCRSYFVDDEERKLRFIRGTQHDRPP